MAEITGEYICNAISDAGNGRVSISFVSTWTEDVNGTLSTFQNHFTLNQTTAQAEASTYYPGQRYTLSLTEVGAPVAATKKKA